MKNNIVYNIYNIVFCKQYCKQWAKQYQTIQYNKHNTKTIITMQTIKKIGNLLFLGRVFIFGYCEKVW